MVVVAVVQNVGNVATGVSAHRETDGQNASVEEVKEMNPPHRSSAPEVCLF